MNYLQDIRKKYSFAQDYSDEEIIQALPKINPSLFGNKPLTEVRALALQDNNVVADTGRFLASGAVSSAADVVTGVERTFDADWGTDESMKRKADRIEGNIDPLYREAVNQSGFRPESENSLLGVVGTSAKSLGSMASFAPVMIASAIAAPVTGGTSIPTAIGIIGGGIVNGMMIGGSSYNGAIEAVNALPDSDFNESPLFKEYLADYGDFDTAKAKMAKDLADEQFKTGASVGLASGAILGPMLNRVVKGGQGAIKGFMAGAAPEAIQEFGESGAESYGQQETVSKITGKPIDTNLVLRDAAFGATMGGIAGGVPGATIGLLTPRQDIKPDPLKEAEDKFVEASQRFNQSSNVDDAIQASKDMLKASDVVTATDLGLKMPSEATPSQVPGPMPDRRHNDSMKGIDGLIITARKMGFLDEEAKLTVAKRLYTQYKAALDSGDGQLADSYLTKGNKLYRDVVETPDMAPHKDQFPVPYMAEVMPPEAPNFTMADSAPEGVTVDSTAVEVPTNRLNAPPPPRRLTTDNVIYGQKPAQEFTPVSDIYEGVGQNVIDRAADLPIGIERQPGVEGRSISNADLMQSRPIAVWTGKAGDGYPTAEAAQAGLRNRQKAEPSLQWTVEQMPSGRFQVAGYGQAESTAFDPVSVSQTPENDTQQDLSVAGETQVAEQSSVTPDIRLKTNGTPFKTEKEAGISGAFRTNPGAEVVPVEGGFGVRVTPGIDQTESANEQKTSRLSILENSLAKKKAKEDAAFKTHFDSVKAANGQPLNDKRNGAATLKKWDKQSEAIRNAQADIEKTERAIEREKDKIANVSVANDRLPKHVLGMVESGEINQWKRHPNTFFVPGVDKGRIAVDLKTGKITFRYVSEIPKEQYAKFRDTANKLLAESRKAEASEPAAKSADAPVTEKGTIAQPVESQSKQVDSTEPVAIPASEQKTPLAQYEAREAARYARERYNNLTQSLPEKEITKYWKIQEKAERERASNLRKMAKSAKERGEKVKAIEIELRYKESLREANAHAARAKEPAQIVDVGPDPVRSEKAKARIAALKKPNNQRDSVIQFIAKMGGISKGYIQDITGDTKNTDIPFVGKLFTDDGTSPDDMASLLAQNGYITEPEMEDGGGVNRLYDLINRERNGEKIYAIGSKAEEAQRLEMEIADLETRKGQAETERESKYAELADQYGQEYADRAREYGDWIDQQTNDYDNEIGYYEDQIERQDEDRSAAQDYDRVRADRGEADGEKSQAGKDQKGDGAAVGKTVEGKIRAEFNKGSVQIGVAKPITITHNGVTQQFMARQDRLSNGRANAVIHFSALSKGRMLPGMPEGWILSSYKLTGKDEVVEEGLPASITDEEAQKYNANFDDSQGFQLGQETEAERQSREAREESARKAEAKKKREADAKARAEADKKATDAAVKSSVDRFELGQDADQQLSGQINAVDSALTQNERELNDLLAKPVDKRTQKNIERIDQLRAAIKQERAAKDGQDILFSKDKWYRSALAETVSGMGKIADKNGMVHPNQAKLWLQSRQKAGDFKAEEMEWTGVNDWLDTLDGKVSVDAIHAFVDGNGVQVEEVNISNDPPSIAEVAASEKLFDLYYQGKYSFDEFQNDEDRTRFLADHFSLEPTDAVEGLNKTKYRQYQLHGGENYRELLLTLPKKSFTPNITFEKWFAQNYKKPLSEASDRLRYTAEINYKNNLGGDIDSANYKSAHWDQPNVIAHIRMNDRTDSDGNKVLFIEEVQSDWGQQGRKEGFSRMTPGLQSEYDSLVQKFRTDRTDAENARVRELEAMGANSSAIRIPDAPFVKDTKAWTALALKRIIAHAAENGYDKVAFINGEQSAARYDLSKQVSEIAYNKGTSFLRVLDMKGKEIFNGTKPMDELPDFIGKEAAEKIEAGGNFTQLRDIDLKIGGEGMRGFYDRIVPQVANDVLKKIGRGKVESLAIDGNDQRGFTITDSMRGAVRNRLPLFAKDSQGVKNPHTTATLRAAMDKAFRGVAGALEKAGLLNVITSDQIPEVIRDGRFSVHRNTLTKVRGGWTKEKIRKELKSMGGGGSSGRIIQREIAQFDSAEEFADNIFYHGTGSFVSGAIKPSITMSEKEAETFGGGGYGQRYWAASVSKSKNIASGFTGMSRSGRLYPVVLKKGATVVSMPEIEDSIELEDIIEDLWNRGVDAVRIGDWSKEFSEQELAILNPKAVFKYDVSESYPVFNKKKFDNLSIDQITEIYDKAKDDAETLDAARSLPKAERDAMISSIEDIKFSKDGRIQGYVANGVVTMVADNISQSANVKGLMMHEIGVHLMKLNRSDAEFQRLQKQFEAMAKMKGSKAEAAMNRVPEDTPEHLRLEEGQGYLVEMYPDLAFSKRVIAWIKAKLREWLGSIKGAEKLKAMQWANTLEDSDLIYMAQAAVRAAKNARNVRSRGEMLSSIEGDNGPGTSLWEKAKAKGLDLSKAARMERAKAMGFDVEAYHYSRHGADIETFAGSGGYDLSPFGIGPHVGSLKAATDRMNRTRQDGATYKLLIRKGREFRKPDGSIYGELELSQALADRVDYYADNGKSYVTKLQDLSNSVWDEYDTIPYINDVEAPGEISYIVKPENIRSTNAVFDPDTSSSSQIMASKADSFTESDYRPAIVSWAKERFGNQVAPNGNPAWQNFVEWFGESNVVDSNDRPIVVYHGTNEDFTRFDIGKFGKTIADRLGSSEGYYASIYLTTSKGHAFQYGDNQMDLYVRGNYEIIDAEQEIRGWHEEIGDGTDFDDWIASVEVYDALNADSFFNESIKNASASGKDGVIIDFGGLTFDRGVKVGKVVITGSPYNVKSSTGNAGDFSHSSPDIRYSVGRDEDYQRAHDSLAQKDKTVFDKAKSSLKRMLAPGGNLPTLLFNEKIKRDSQLNVAEADIAMHLAHFDRAIKKVYGNDYDALDVAEQRKINNALKGEPDLTLAPEVREQLYKMRIIIKGFSKDYMEILQRQIDDLTAGLSDGEMLIHNAMKQAYQIEPESNSAADKGKATRAQNKLLDDAKEAADLGKDTQKAMAKVSDIASKTAMLETIQGNLDTYLHRSYRAFDDPDWPKKVSDEVHDAAADYLRARYVEGGMEDADAKIKALQQVKLILTEGTAYDNMHSFIAESKLGAKDLSVLKRRKQIAPEIRALLGEYEDAKINFTKSVSKMARLVMNQRFLDKFKQLGLENGFLFEEKDIPIGGDVKQIAADKSASYSPLNGLYTYREIDQSLVDILGEKNLEGWYKTVVKYNGMIKYGKVVLSPTTQFRNFMSAFFFSMANGHFDLSQSKKAFQAVREELQHKGGQEQYVRKLIGLGVLYDNPNAGEMMDLLKDSQLEENLFNKSAFGKGLREVNNVVQRIYGHSDNFWKVIGFENEKAMLMKYKGMTETEAEVEAAERIRNTYPTYSMIGKGIRWLRTFPLVGSFVSFPAEIIRTQYHIVRYMAQDWKDSRAMGARKAVGLAMVSGLAYGLQAVSMALAGFDDDDEEAIRQFAPPWQKNSNLIAFGRDEKGNMLYMDFSFLDPYNYLKRPLNAILRDQPIDEALKSAAVDMASPFLGMDIAAGSIAEVLMNKKETGGRVFNPNAPVVDQSQAIVTHLGKALAPGVVGNIDRLAKASTDTISPSGKQYDLSDEVAGVFGFRWTTFDPKSGIFYKAYEFQDKKRDASLILSAVARNPNKVDDEDIADAYRLAEETRFEAYEDMIALVKASMNSGLTRQEVVRALRNSGISQADSFNLANGRVPPFKPSNAMMKNAINKAGVLFDKGVADEFRRRQKVIQEQFRASQR